MNVCFLFVFLCLFLLCVSRPTERERTERLIKTRLREIMMVQYILNVTREIDNFFPSLFEYHNIRVYDEEATDLLAYWNDTYKFISRAKKAGAKCLVHCKMGVSRSASTVIAYAMKEYGWDLEQAFEYVKERRVVTKPNPSFMRQLEEYQGILMFPQKY
uniref:protein-serine/threonine phosphatase n=1 Tax=Sinocyclocheilus grahami TaxID=75366 RepID=A0A672JX06_SINGR